VLHFEHKILRCWNMDTSESRSEMPGMFWTVVLEKHGENQLDGWCENEGVLRSQWGEECHASNKQKVG
jgi:hypothetical protein